jgi:4-hydroxy-tetrahydrodipicolinate synthase
MPAIRNYRGIIPAIACPFTADYRIDEPALRKLASWLAGHAGVVAVMTNGHTGEVFSLTPTERATVTRIVADELRGRLPVISSIVCEGFADAAEHGRMAAEAGAVALDVMPPHHWLRFGCTPRHALAYFDAIHRRLLPSTWSATFIPRGLGRRTRQSSWPTSHGCRTCRHSRSGSAT